MKHLLFIDESGNHGLNSIDPAFPVFVLSGILVSEEEYEKMKLEINDIKNEFWEDKKVIFHSRDIRKCEKEFIILFDLKIKEQFYLKLNGALERLPYSVFITAIEKEKYIKKFGKITNSVYEISTSSLIDEALNFILKNAHHQDEFKIIFEKRGKKEDNELLKYVNTLISAGTQNLTAEQLKRFNITIDFKNKADNINGLQIADLIAYPTARFVIDFKRANPSYDLIKSKIVSFTMLP
ncbi:MAG: DUF3800 domain-containing protein [Ignavibacteria bacterium]|nr:DUF3800 domain-containing protein [Ignavibacteria bacterium]